MATEEKFLVDVGMKDLPFPIKVISRACPAGQATIADISISARIMRRFEARSIDKFIQIVHQHRDRIGTNTLRVNIMDYIREFEAHAVKIDFDFPFFMEKLTPVSREKCLVRYMCSYSAKALSATDKAVVIFKIGVPCITTYPASQPEKPKGLFGQQSIVNLEIHSDEDIYPEDMVDIVDKHALAPIYSFLTEEDQDYIIETVHTKVKSSVIVVDEIREEMARKRDISSYSIRCANFGMLHSYSTVIGTKKSMWVPFSSYDEDEI
jgi:GTP cyclohydrolase IB